MVWPVSGESVPSGRLSLESEGLHHLFVSKMKDTKFLFLPCFARVWGKGLRVVLLCFSFTLERKWQFQKPENDKFTFWIKIPWCKFILFLVAKTCCGSGQGRAWCDYLTVKMLVAGILCRRWFLLRALLVSLFTVARPIPWAGRACRFSAKVNIAILFTYPNFPVFWESMFSLHRSCFFYYLKNLQVYCYCYSTYTFIVICIIRVAVQ